MVEKQYKDMGIFKEGFGLNPPETKPKALRVGGVKEIFIHKQRIRPSIACWRITWKIKGKE